MMKKINEISIIILTKNSQKYLGECLSALIEFDEIVVLDNGSVDKTMEIAKRFKNVKIYEHEFIGFGQLKQLAVSHTKNDWVLSIDSDEIFSKELVEEILELKLDKKIVYSIRRDNYYDKKLVKCCGWDNDVVERLFNKTYTNFNGKKVHEGVLIKEDTKIVQLNNSFKHYTFDSLAELISKMDKYSTLYAQERKGKKKSSVSKAFFSAFYTFFKNFILQKGFLCGYEGLIISISNANGTFYKYAKLYEENKK